MNFEQIWNKAHVFHEYIEDNSLQLEIRYSSEAFYIKFDTWFITLAFNDPPSCQKLPSTPPSIVPRTYLEERLIQPLEAILCRDDCLGLHASALQLDTKGIALLGDPFAGKSTLAAKLLALALDNARCFADDFLVIQTTDAPQMLPGVQSLYLRTHQALDPVATHSGQILTKECYQLHSTYRSHNPALLHALVFVQPSDHFSITLTSKAVFLPLYLRQVFDANPATPAWKKMRFQNAMKLLKSPNIKCFLMSYNRSRSLMDFSDVEQFRTSLFEHLK